MVAVSLLLATSLYLSGESAPCVNQPEPGSLLEATVTSTISRGTEGVIRYGWRLANSPASRRSIRSVSVVDMPEGVEAPNNWRSLTPSAGSGRPIAILAAAADDDRYDVKPGADLVFQARTANYPSVTIVRLYPRRDLPCLPTTSTDEEALEAAGWTEEKLRKLSLVDFWTQRVITIAPLLIAPQGKATREALFLASVTRLRSLREYLSRAPSTTKPELVPVPLSSLPETEESLPALRTDALRRLASREDHVIIELLYSFYSGLEPLVVSKD